MKLSLPIKLGVFVVLLFAAVIAACLLWTPLKVRYYSGKLHSDNPKERVVGVDGLISMGSKGVKALAGVLGGGEKEAEFLSKNWKYYNTPIPGDKLKRYPLHIAAESNFPDAARLIIDRGADLNTTEKIGYTPLHRAAWRGHKSVAALLLERGADVNAKGFGNLTPLHNAASRGYKDIVAILLGKGADVNAEDNSGSTPLHKAVEKGRKDIVDLLIEKGADVDVLDEYGHDTLLILAIKSSYEDIVRLLVNNGADVNLEDREFGMSPLHWAVGENSDNLVLFLIEHGANVNVRQRARYTPLDWAHSLKRSKISSLLRACGGKTGKEIREQENKETRKKEIDNRKS